MIGLLCDEFMCADAHHDVAGLDTDHEVVISEVLYEVYFIQGTLHQPFCGHAMIFLYQRLLERSAVDTDPDRNVPFLCRRDHRTDPILGADITGIDPDLVRAVFDRQ